MMTEEDIGMPIDEFADLEVEDESRDQPYIDRRSKSIREYEIKFIKDCTMKVSNMKIGDARERFDTSNKKAWLWWPSRKPDHANRYDKEYFYSRAVGTWYPAKMFHEMQDKLFCPHCDHSVDHRTGKWVDIKDTREVIALEATWLLVGRQYQCRYRGCKRTFRNTTDDFLRTCPELTRHRFFVINRKKYMIERPLAKFSYDIWVRCGQQALDSVLGAHVRRFEQVREEYYLANLDPDIARHPPKVAEPNTVAGLFAWQKRINGQADIEFVSQRRHDRELRACTLAKWKLQDLPTSCSGLTPHLKSKLSQVGWRFDEDRAKSREPMLVTDVMMLTEDYVKSKDQNAWLKENFAIIASGKNFRPIRVRSALQKAHKAVKKLWEDSSSLTVSEVKQLVHEKEERELRNKARRQEITEEETKVKEAMASRDKSKGPESFGNFDNPDGYNGFQLHRFFLDDVNTDLFTEMARPMLREIVSAEANILRVDCTFKFAKQIKVTIRNDEGKVRVIQPFAAIMTIANEFNQIVWVQGLREGEKLAGEMFIALKDFDNHRKEMAGEKGYAPKIIYTDNCCLVRSQIKSIWPNVPVKLDAFHWLNRFKDVMNVPPSHPLRKQFFNCLSAAVFSPNESLFSESLKEIEREEDNGDEEEGKIEEDGDDEVINLNRKRRREIERRIPNKDDLFIRITSTLYAFLETDAEAAMENLRTDFFKKVKRRSKNKSVEKLEEEVRALLSRTGRGTTLHSKLPSNRRAVRLFRSKAKSSNPDCDSNSSKGDDLLEFFNNMLRHVEYDCLSDPDATFNEFIYTATTDGKHITARGTSARERFHRVLNELIGSRCVSVLRGDTILLYAALRANRLRASELHPIHKKMPRVDLHSSLVHRLRINSLFRVHYPHDDVPFPETVLPASVDPALSMGLSLLPLLGDNDICNTRSEKESPQVGPYTSSVEVPEVKDCCLNIKKALKCEPPMKPLNLVEQVWAILMAMAYNNQPDILSKLRSLISNLEFVKGKQALKQMILKNLGLEVLASPAGAGISIKLLEEVSKKAKPNEKLQLGSVVAYITEAVGHLFQVEVLTMTLTGGEYKVSKVPSDAEIGNQAKFKVSIGHVIAPTRSRVDRKPRSPPAKTPPDVIKDDDILSAFAAAKAHVSYSSPRRFSWFAFKLSPVQLMIKKSTCTQMTYSKQVETSFAAKNLSAPIPKDGDADEVAKRHTKRSRPSGMCLLKPTTPFPSGPNLSVAERNERKLFTTLLREYGFTLEASAGSTKSARVFTHLWNSFVRQPSLLKGIIPDIKPTDVTEKSERNIRDMIHKCRVQSQIPYEASQCHAKVESAFLRSGARPIDLRTLEKPPLISLSSEQAAALQESLRRSESGYQHEVLLELLGRSSHLGKRDDCAVALDCSPGVSPYAPWVDLHRARPAGVADPLDLRDVLIHGKSWRCSSKLNHRYFCSRCLHRRSKVHAPSNGSCDGKIKIWREDELLKLPRHMFKNYPSYLSPIRDSNMSPAEKSLRDDYVVILKKMADMLHTSDLLPVSLPEFPQIRTQGCVKSDIQLKLLLDHAMMSSSSGSPTKCVSNFLMDLYLQMLQVKQVSVEERRRETVFFTSFRHTSIKEDLDTALRKIFKNSHEQREFVKFKNSNSLPTLLFPPHVKRIMMPLLAQSHWTLVMLCVEDKTLYSYDPLKNSDDGRHDERNKSILRQLELDESNWSVKKLSGHQENGYDCGVYVMAVINGLLHGDNAIAALAESIMPSNGNSDLMEHRRLQFATFADILQDTINFTLAKASSTREELLSSFILDFKPRELEEEFVAIVEESSQAVDDSLNTMSESSINLL